MLNKTKLKAYNSPTFLAYALIAPAAIYILCIVAWPLIENSQIVFHKTLAWLGKITLVPKILPKCLLALNLIK